MGFCLKSRNSTVGDARLCNCRNKAPLRVQSLHKALNQQPRKVLTSPDEATFECLTCLRKPDVSSFRELLMPEARKEASTSGRGVLVGDRVVQEAGPLAGFPHVMDTAARRVLPGHLLRRCRILSHIQLGSTCLQRVALTACSGEESVFNWKLVNMSEEQQQEQQRHIQSISGLEEDAAGPRSVASNWLLCSISRDCSADEEELPSKPHPRAAPELVIMAQLAALRRGDIITAASFNMSGRNLMGPWEQQLAAYRALLREPSHHLLLTHHSFTIRSTAIPSQRTFVAEVQLQPQMTASHAWTVADRKAPGDEWPLGSSFVWELGMQASGCWYVQAVRALPGVMGP